MKSHGSLEERSVLRRYFDTIAPSYQLMNTLISLGLDRIWRQRLIKKASLRPHLVCLDIACGPGDVMQAGLAKEPESYWIGLDYAYGMLQHGSKSLNLIQGDGIHLPFASSSFDRITISFGLRNMPDHKEFFKEARRVLKPQGRLIILECSLPLNPILRLGNLVFLYTVLPLISSLFGRNRAAYRYLARSIRHFPRQEEIQQLMEASGLINCDFILLHGGITTLFSGESKG